MRGSRQYPGVHRRRSNSSTRSSSMIAQASSIESARPGSNAAGAPITEPPHSHDARRNSVKCFGAVIRTSLRQTALALRLLLLCVDGAQLWGFTLRARTLTAHKTAHLPANMRRIMRHQIRVIDWPVIAASKHARTHQVLGSKRTMALSFGRKLMESDSHPTVREEKLTERKDSGYRNVPAFLLKDQYFQSHQNFFWFVVLSHQNAKQIKGKVRSCVYHSAHTLGRTCMHAPVPRPRPRPPPAPRHSPGPHAQAHMPTHARFRPCPAPRPA